VISPLPRLLPDSRQHLQDIYFPDGIEPEFPASERPQSDALNRAITEVGGILIYNTVKYIQNRMVQKGRLHLKERRTVQCTVAGIEGMTVISVYYFHYKGMSLSPCDKKMNLGFVGPCIFTHSNKSTN
jgi:hypothetical protein